MERYPDEVVGDVAEACADARTATEGVGAEGSKAGSRCRRREDGRRGYLYDGCTASERGGLVGGCDRLVEDMPAEQLKHSITGGGRSPMRRAG